MLQAEGLLADGRTGILSLQGRGDSRQDSRVIFRTSYGVLVERQKYLVGLAYFSR